MTRVGLTQRVSVIEEYGERRDCLDQEWTVLLESLGYTPFILPNRIDDVDSYLDALDLDAVILTSGNDLATLENPSNPAPERDVFETVVLEYAIRTETPVLGVCRGLEFINTYFGGTLSPVADHVACTHAVEFSKPDRYRQSEGTELSLPDTTDINSYHDWGIERDDVGNKLEVLGIVEDETVEAVVHESHPIWGIMWHPERESPSQTLDRQILNHVLGGTQA